MKLSSFVGILFLFETFLFINAIDKFDANNNTNLPTVMVTWDYADATAKAWDVIFNKKKSALDAIEEGCSLCERKQCRTTVGFGGSPDESGETTLDAMIMDGVTMDVGAVGGLRFVKNAISVARKVLHNTKHTLLTGSLSTKFASQMGFRIESLQTNESTLEWERWKGNNCQPNFWKNVEPNSATNCGPYKPSRMTGKHYKQFALEGSEENHDTIGIVAIDSQGRTAAGTSTNGANHKIPGRVGDSPVPGAGAYADQEVGAAASTGDGDVMMRFLPSFLAVEEMRRGTTPAVAAKIAINRIMKHYPNFFGGIIVMNNRGDFGAACNGMKKFPYYIANPTLGVALHHVDCNNYYGYTIEIESY